MGGREEEFWELLALRLERCVSNKIPIHHYHHHSSLPFCNPAEYDSYGQDQDQEDEQEQEQQEQDHDPDNAGHCSHGSGDPPGMQHRFQRRILPLLRRLCFLKTCHSLPALSSILHSLSSAGFHLPLSSRIALSSCLLRRLLVAEKNSDNNITSLQSRQLFAFAKRVVYSNFHVLREAVALAKLPETGSFAAASKGDFALDECMLCFLEGEICWSIREEPRLLQYVLENEGAELSRGATMENCRLAGFLQQGLQSQDSKTRLQSLKLAMACSFNSERLFVRLFPLLEISLYLEDFPIRETVLASFIDLIYIHHQSLQCQSVIHLLLPFLYAPTEKLQIAAVIGCGRLLLFDCFPDDTECFLAALLERYVHPCPDHATQSTRSFQSIAQILFYFFQEYSGGKNMHQDEIANTLVYMCLEKMEDGLLMINQEGQCIQDNPERAEEGIRFHLALRFGLSLCKGNVLSAVADSLILNLKEQAGFPFVNKNACFSWLTSQ